MVKVRVSRHIPADLHCLSLLVLKTDTIPQHHRSSNVLPHMFTLLQTKQTWSVCCRNAQSWSDLIKVQSSSLCPNRVLKLMMAEEKRLFLASLSNKKLGFIGLWRFTTLLNVCGTFSLVVSG